MKKDICKICNNLEVDKTIISRQHSEKNTTEFTGERKAEPYKYCVAKNIPLNNLVVTMQSCNSFVVADTATPEQKYESLSI
jgi:hypothetical protein